VLSCVARQDQATTPLVNEPQKVAQLSACDLPCFIDDHNRALRDCAALKALADGLRPRKTIPGSSRALAAAAEPERSMAGLFGRLHIRWSTKLFPVPAPPLNSVTKFVDARMNWSARC
jgi:hypothetical protein